MRTALWCAFDAFGASSRTNSTIDTMGKAKAKQRDKIGFRCDSKEGKYLAKILKTGEVSAGITPKAIKELHPVFNKFIDDSFAGGLRRMKTKLGLNVRSNAVSKSPTIDASAAS